MDERAFASATQLGSEIRDRRVGCLELLDFVHRPGRATQPGAERDCRLAGGDRRLRPAAGLRRSLLPAEALRPVAPDDTYPGRQRHDHALLSLEAGLDLMNLAHVFIRRDGAANL